MGLLRKKQNYLVIYLYILLVIMIFIEVPKFALGYGRFSKFNQHEKHQLQGYNGNFATFKNGKNSEDNGDDDVIFEDDKRKVHTGPNPLHNR
ncbi:hypothetical protein RND81_12G011600 [Saponaria officinalis]|uniref:Uncharacterized protein n=1 Tax=Saponaria officinalis TaxID=3572 RepID=A0AAW1H4C5_SAPOF